MIILAIMYLMMIQKSRLSICTDYSRSVCELMASLGQLCILPWAKNKTQYVVSNSRENSLVLGNLFLLLAVVPLVSCYIFSLLSPFIYLILFLFFISTFSFSFTCTFSISHVIYFNFHRFLFLLFLLLLSINLTSSFFSPYYGKCKLYYFSFVAYTLSFICFTFLMYPRPYYIYLNPFVVCITLFLTLTL